MREHRWVLAFALIAFVWGIAFSVAEGAISFVGDEWRPVTIAYFEPDNLEALADIARDAKRPAQGIHILLLYRLFQLNDAPYRATTNLLHVVNCFLWMLVVLNTFPNQKLLAFLSGLLALCMPILTRLTNAYSYDGTRIAMILYWISVLAFQRWIASDTKWRRLAFVFLGCLSLLLSLWTYENALALAPVTLFCLWIVWRGPDPTWNRTSLVKWGVTIGSIGFTYLFWWESRRRMRLVLHTEISSQFSLASGLEALVGFVKHLSISIGSIDGVVVGIGLILLLSLAFVAWPLRKNVSLPRNQTISLVVWGLSLYLFGVLPYALAAYDHPRVYSAGIFGLILIVAWLITRIPTRFLTVAVPLICLVGAVYLAVPFSNRQRFRDRYEGQQLFFTSLLQAVPQLDQDGHFVIVEDDPTLINSDSNFRYMFSLFYDREELDYTLLTKYLPPPAQLAGMQWSEGRVTDEKLFLPSGDILGREGIVLVRAHDNQFEPMSELTPDDGVQLLNWDAGTPPLKSQTQHVLQTDDNIKRLQALGLLQASEP